MQRRPFYRRKFEKANFLFFNPISLRIQDENFFVIDRIDNCRPIMIAKNGVLVIGIFIFVPFDVAAVWYRIHGFSSELVVKRKGGIFFKNN